MSKELALVMKNQDISCSCLPSFMEPHAPDERCCCPLICWMKIRWIHLIITFVLRSVLTNVLNGPAVSPKYFQCSKFRKLSAFFSIIIPDTWEEFDVGVSLRYEHSRLLFSAPWSVVGFCINCHILQIEPTQLRIMIQFVYG